MPTPDIDRLLHAGITALRAGDKDTAREKLTQVIQLDQTHEQGWLWLSGAVDQRDEQLICLENVLTINPHNELARKALVKLGGVPPEMSEQEPPPDDASPLLEHAPMRMLKDREKEKFRDVTEQDIDDPWKVLSEEGYTIDATIVKSPEQMEERSFVDLVMAWAQLLIFNPHGDFAAELANPHIAHIIINLVFSSFLLIAGLIIGLAISLQISTQRIPVFLEQLDAVFEATEDSGADAGVPDLFADGSAGSARESFDQLIADMVSQVQTELGFRIWLWVLAFVVSAVILLFIGQFMRGFIASWVSGFVNGKGDAIVTTHALTMALVVTLFVQLPLMFIYPFLPLGGIISINGLYAIYTWAVNGFALGHAQRFNTLVGMGMIFATNFVLQTVAGVFFGCLGFLLSL